MAFSEIQHATLGPLIKGPHLLARTCLDHRKSTTVLGGNSYLSWFYDRVTIKHQHTQEPAEGYKLINRGPIRKFLPK